MKEITQAKIGVGIQNGQLATRIQIGKITQAEVAMLIVHLDIIKDDLKNRFKMGVKKLE